LTSTSPERTSVTGRIVFLLGLSLIMMVPLSVVAQGLTSEEVQAVMEDPYISRAS
jgi:hypothetical protein